MNKIKRAFLWILQGKVIYDGDIVPVVIKDHWYDTTPSITIQGFAKENDQYLRQLVTVRRPLPKHHPLYNEENPKKRYPHLAESSRKSYEIQINVWCNDEKQRDKIVRQVRHLLFLCQNAHYTYCMNYDYDTHECNTIGRECEARTDKGYRGLRGELPQTKRLSLLHYLK